MNVAYYLSIVKWCKVTGILLVNVKLNEDGEVLIINDAYDAKIAHALLIHELELSGDLDSVVSRVRLAEEYTVPS